MESYAPIKTTQESNLLISQFSLRAFENNKKSWLFFPFFPNPRFASKSNWCQPKPNTQGTQKTVPLFFDLQVETKNRFLGSPDKGRGEKEAIHQLQPLIYHRFASSALSDLIWLDSRSTY